jgi:uncharacterized protein (TIGR04255 family)
MANESPTFRKPPVVETVIGVQFVPLSGWTNGHPGWFWKRYLGDEWKTAADTQPLPDQFERFGDQRQWAPPGVQLFFGPAGRPARVQITTATGDRMIQVQPNRFHYNWQKREGVYPSYRTMKAEFDELFRQFWRFVQEAGLGEVSPNQWELTYVDHIPRGPLWETPADWHKVLPGLLNARAELGGCPMEGVAGEWTYVINPERGRLHVELRPGRLGGPDSPDGLVLQTTARGPVRQESGWGLDAGLDLGHDTIIRAFLEMTSPEAQRAWGVEGQ